MIQRNLFDTQMEIGDQLIEQNSNPHHRDAILRHASAVFTPWMRLYPNATEQERWAYFDSITDPSKNKRGEVYCRTYWNEALRILNLK